MSNKLLKSGVIVSVMTFLSRIFGLVRDIVVANLMGAGAGSDVFFVANKIPNFLRRLFAEGAFAQAFIPVLTEIHERNDKKELHQFIAQVSGTLGVIVFITAILGVIGSSVVAAVFGAGWFMDHVNEHPDGSKYLLLSSMLKITFPYIFFISLTGFAGAVLNALNRFAVSAFTPVLLNVSIIVCAWLFSSSFKEPAFALAWGVFLGGVIQLLFQLPFLFKAGLLVRPSWGWRDNNVSKVRKLMIPALFGVSVSQINLLFDTFIASFLMTGSVSWLYYSDRLLEFPLGLFGIAIATVILPTLSRNHVNNDPLAFSKNLDWAFRIIVSLGIPAACGLIVLAWPLLMVIFQRGAFDISDAYMASYSLVAYAFGLLSFMLVKILAPAFYSRQDTKTPVKYGIIAMAANMFFNLCLAIPFGYVGLAVATSISGSLNAYLLYRGLSKQGVYRISRTSWWFVAKVCIATISMTLALYYYLSFRVVHGLWPELSVSARITELLVMIVLGVAVYAICLLLLKVTRQDFKNVSHT